MRNHGKLTNLYKLNSILLNKYWVKEEIQGEFKYFETNENTTYPNLELLLLHPLRGKFVAVNTYINKERFQKLMLPLKELEKEQTKPKGNNKDQSRSE